MLRTDRPTSTSRRSVVEAEAGQGDAGLRGQGPGAEAGEGPPAGSPPPLPCEHVEPSQGPLASSAFPVWSATEGRLRSDPEGPGRPPRPEGLGGLCALGRRPGAAARWLSLLLPGCPGLLGEPAFGFRALKAAPRRLTVWAAGLARAWEAASGPVPGSWGGVCVVKPRPLTVSVISR